MNDSQPDFNAIINTAAAKIHLCLERAQAPHEILAAIHAFRDFAEGVAMIAAPVSPESSDGLSQKVP